MAYTVQTSKMSVPLALVAIVLTSGAIWVGSNWLETASAKLAGYYGLPPVVQGGIIAAAGSSFPEFASVVFAALAGSFGLGVGGVVGSAMFNILVIPALTVVLSPGTIGASRTLVHKENLFYILAIVVLFLTFALALIYNPTGEEQMANLTRPLALFPLAVYGFYLFLQWQDTVDHDTGDRRPEISILRQWGRLVLGLVVLLGAVYVLVEAVLELGDAFGVPDFLWGVTVVAAATSLPDTIVSIQSANSDDDVASIANVLGSNTFDLLVVIPVGVLIVGTEPVDFGVTAPMLSALLLGTLVLFVTLRTSLSLTDREAYTLLVTYGLFLAWVGAEATGMTGVLPA
jgi:cation:H+ antiporter